MHGLGGTGCDGAALWPIKGGTARKQRKGFAGPDLSNTGDQIKRDLNGCDSTMAFVSSHATYEPGASVSK